MKTCKECPIPVDGRFLYCEEHRGHVAANRRYHNQGIQTGRCRYCKSMAEGGRYCQYHSCLRNSRNRVRKRVKRSGVDYRESVESQCSRCGFEPEDMVQLDVDHINGDRRDNSPENLATLCANCHRLKTYRKEKFDVRRPS